MVKMEVSEHHNERDSVFAVKLVCWLAGCLASWLADCLYVCLSERVNNWLRG